MKEEFPIIKEWASTAKDIFAATTLFPRNVRASLCMKIENYTLEVQDLLIDAFYSKTKREYLLTINNRLEKLRFLIRFSYDLRFVNESRYITLVKRINKTGAMVGGWLKTCTV
jgi:hypothetical protein